MVSGVNTCHQPFLTLQNYWAELCFLQPAQRAPLPGSPGLAGAGSTCLQAWRGLWGEGLMSLKAQASNFCPKPQTKAVFLDRGQEWGAAALAALQPPV